MRRRIARRNAVALLVGLGGAFALPGLAAAASPAVLGARARAVVAPGFQILERSFPGLAAAPADASATAGSPAGTRVVSYAGDNIAHVSGPDGNRVVVATYPLRTLDAHGRSLPVDLTLGQTASGALVPRNAPFALTIDPDAAGGFAIGPDADHAVHVTPLSAAPSAPAAVRGNELFASGTHADADTLVRPTVAGVETFEQLRGPDAPGVFAWRLDLRPGQRAEMRDGRIVVSQDGQPIVAVPAPAALDANQRPVPTMMQLVGGDVVSVSVSHRQAGVAYPVVVDPDWTSSYDWSTRANELGTEGWFKDSANSPLYDLSLLVGPQGGVPAGLLIEPVKNGTTFPIGAEAQWVWRAPGTTLISAADFRGVTEVNDSARQTTRLGIFQGGPKGPNELHDFSTPGAGEFVLDIHVEYPPDLGPQGRFAVMQMFTPPCAPGERSCPRAIPPDNGTLAQVGSVEISLVDDDLPTAAASGSLRDLAGTWSNLTGTEDLNVTLHDGGSGVASWALAVTDSAGRHQLAPPASDPALCDPDHNTTGQGSNICPADLNVGPTSIAVGSLPEGQLHFDLEDTDFAGNASAGTGDAWDVFVDRTAPALAITGGLRDAAQTWADPTRLAGDLQVAAADPAPANTNVRAGVASVEVTGTDEAGTEVLHDVTSTCPAPRPGAAPCPLTDTVDEQLSTSGLGDGDLSLSAAATDFAGNRSAPQAWTVHLDRTKPIARAEGDLDALQDQWTNRTAPVDMTVTGRDAGSGVQRLQVVAINADGRTVVAKADTCAAAADHDPADGSCPHKVTKTLTIDPASLPDGKSTFEVQAIDLTGHVSDASESWDTYVDHTPPPAPTGIVVTSSASDTASITWDRVPDPPNGSTGVTYQYLVQANGQTVVNWTSTPYPQAVVPGLAPGTDVKVLVRAIDRAKNVSAEGEGDGKLFAPDPDEARASASAASRDPVQRTVDQYAPVLLEDSNDGFYPISAYSQFDLVTPRGKRPCIHTIKACVEKERGVCLKFVTEHPRCVRGVTPQTRLKATQGLYEYVEYPEPDDTGKQEQLIRNTLNVLHRTSYQEPQHHARQFYYFVGKPESDHSRTIQYWYFFTYNYFVIPTPLGDKIEDRHEGDLEHVDIHFDRNWRPLSVTLSRHETYQYGHHKWGEGVELVSMKGEDPTHPTHIVVHGAYGDHGMYEACGSSELHHEIAGIKFPDGFRDHTCWRSPSTIGTQANDPHFSLSTPAATHAWACWQGAFGNSGPGAPLRQSTVPGAADVCAGAEGDEKAGIADTAPPDNDPTSRCSAYEQPPGDAGLFAVACDQAALTREFAGEPTTPLGWRLATGGSIENSDGAVATARSRDPAIVPGLRLVALRNGRPEVYVAVVTAAAETSVLFPALAMSSGETLSLRSPAHGNWELIDADGHVVASATPTKLPIPPQSQAGASNPPLPTHLKLRHGARRSRLSWIASGATSHGVVFYVIVRKGRHGRATPVATVVGHGQRRFAAVVRTGKLVGRTIQVVAVGGGRSRASRPIAGPRAAKPNKRRHR